MGGRPRQVPGRVTAGRDLDAWRVSRLAPSRAAKLEVLGFSVTTFCQWYDRFIYGD